MGLSMHKALSSIRKPRAHTHTHTLHACVTYVPLFVLGETEIVSHLGTNLALSVGVNVKDQVFLSVKASPILLYLIP